MRKFVLLGVLVLAVSAPVFAEGAKSSEPSRSSQSPSVNRESRTDDAVPHCPNVDVVSGSHKVTPMASGDCDAAYATAQAFCQTSGGGAACYAGALIAYGACT